MAAAAVNLDTGVGSGGIYASELVIPAPSLTLSAGAAADQQATVILGAAFGIDTAAYVRYDLSTGTFAANPTLAVAGGTTQVSQGGAGFNYVIFQVSPAAGQSLPQAAVVTLQGVGVTVTSQATVNVQYRLYETLTAAVNQTPNTVLKTASGAFLSFANAVSVSSVAVPDAVADVSAANGPYTAFVPAAAPTPTYSRQVSNFAVTYTPRALANGTATTLGALIANTNAVTLDGDWSAAQNAHIHSSPTCSVASFALAGTINAAKTTASFAPLTAATITAQPWYICYEIAQPNSIAIPVSTFTGTVDLVPAGPAVAVSDGPTATGQITRNGTVLKAAFAEATSAAGVSSTISLTNTSSRAANFTVKCLLNSGSAAGRPGTVPANTALRFGLASAGGLACPAANVRGVEITFDVPNGSVIGSVVRQNTSTGAASFDGMVGNQ